MTASAKISGNIQLSMLLCYDNPRFLLSSNTGNYGYHFALAFSFLQFSVFWSLLM